MNYGRCDASGKVKFPTAPIAMLELSKARKLHTAQGRSKIEERYHDCEYCNGYHLTSMKKEKYEALVR